MDRNKFHEANLIYSDIELEKSKRIKLTIIKNKITDILRGHIEIPDVDIIKAWAAIDKLIQHLDDYIKKEYEKIDKL